jgi:hypothetical protein
MSGWLLGQLGIAYVFSVPAWFWGRKLVQWQLWEYLVPLTSVIFGNLVVLQGWYPAKSLGNVAIEPLLVTGLAGLMPWLRLGLRKSWSIVAPWDAILLAVFPLVVSLLLAYLLPSMPE